MSECCNDCGADDGYTPGRALPSLQDWLALGREEVDCGTASTAGTGLFLYRRFTGHLVVPKPMMHFCPGSGNFPADDGIEAAAHHGRAHVHMNDEAADGCEGDDDVDGDGKLA